MLRLSDSKGRVRKNWLNQSFSGTDWIPVFTIAGGFIESAPLISTITLSYYTDLSTSRVLGQRLPKNHRKGYLNVAGTIIGVATDRSPFWDVQRHYVHDYYYSSNKTIQTHELPPFDLTLVGMTEGGQITYCRIFGITIQQGGYTFSTQDVYTEYVYQYTALFFEEPFPSRNEGELDDPPLSWHVDPSIFFGALSAAGYLTTGPTLTSDTGSGYDIGMVLGRLYLLRRKIFYLQSLITAEVIDRTQTPVDNERLRAKLTDEYNKALEIYHEFSNMLDSSINDVAWSRIQGTMFSVAGSDDAVRLTDKAIGYARSDISIYPREVYAGIYGNMGEFNKEIEKLRELYEVTQSPISVDVSNAISQVPGTEGHVNQVDRTISMYRDKYDHIPKASIEMLYDLYRELINYRRNLISMVGYDQIESPTYQTLYGKLNRLIEEVRTHFN